MVELSHSSILVVDDSASVRIMLKSTLELEKYKVVLANSGEEAITLLNLKPVDLILLDINMPGIDGYETCKRIKAIPELTRIPVIFISTTIDDKARIMSFEIGATDFINKPINQANALMRVKQHLNLYLKQRTLNQVKKQIVQKAEELQKINVVMLEREMTIIDLKEQINEQCKALDRPQPYAVVWETRDND